MKIPAALALFLVAAISQAQSRFPDGTGDAPAEKLSNSDLGIRAAYRFTEFPERACPAAAEFVRRGIQSTKTSVVTQTVLPYCRRQSSTVATSASPAARPPTGRYTCLRIGSVANAVADDLTVAGAGRYSVGGRSGEFSYADGTMTFASGPWATSRSSWVGQFKAAGPGAKDPTIVVRDLRDVSAGNKRDLQWCSLAG